MKKLTLTLIIVFLILLSCAEEPETETCEIYTDLCGPGTQDYQICADGYNSWFVVGNNTYMSTDALLTIECGW